MKSKITVGTRGSKLALTQTNQVLDTLRNIYPELEIETRIIKTTGDKILDTELSQIGGKGLFIKEIEEALLAKEIDFAVHSLKDVPYEVEEPFEICAIPTRQDPRDVLITKHKNGVNGLPEGARIATGSLRRKIQLEILRKDIVFEPIRGNIDTRIKKLSNGDLDAIVLAAAGLKRLGWINSDDELNPGLFKKELNNPNLYVYYLETENYIPSVGQGALALETRKGDTETINILKVLNNSNDETCVKAERAFLKRMNGGCSIPIGAYAKMINNKLFIDGFLGEEKTSKIYRKSFTGNTSQAEELGIKLAEEILGMQKD